MVVGVLIARMVAEDGESNWLEGLMLLAVYGILALAFFLLPERNPRQAEPHAAMEAPQRRESSPFGACSPETLAPQCGLPSRASYDHVWYVQRTIRPSA